MIESYIEEPHTFGDVPPANRLTPGVIWVISDDGGVCAVNFLCPCGCGSECYTPVTDATKGQPKTERHWLFSRGPERTCERCEGDGKAHGADRPFEWSGPGTYPGPCPVCHGTGKQPGAVTLSPSVRYTGGCKAHFNITDGKTVMHGDSGR